MKNKYKMRLATSLCACIGFLFFACNDEWKDHYEDGDGNNATASLLAELKEDPSMSKFVEMVHISGLEKQLDGLGSYTIWAPDNNALSGIVTNNLSSADSLKIKMIVQNHIARYNISTSEIEYAQKRVAMLNNKYIVFNKLGQNYFFGDQQIAVRNIVCANGVLHKLEGSVPYLKNLLEYVSDSPMFSDVHQFINKYDSIYLDLQRSKPIGVNEDGYTVYDSVLIYKNKLLDRIGSLQLEDSVYTFILPTNTAFEKAQKIYKNYYKSNGGRDGKLNADSISKQRTDSMIVNNLIFRGNYSNLLLKDSLVTTTGTVFKENRFNMFNGAFEKTSNGDVMVTNDLKQNIYEAIHKPLDRKLGYLPLGTNGLELTLAQYSWQYAQEDTKVQGVEGGFLYMVAAEAAANPILTVYFGPQVVTAKYDIYCTVIPALAADSLLVDESTILDFKMQYREGNRRKTIDLRKGFITNASQTEQVLVASSVAVPFFDAEASLTVTINVPTSERDKYKRRVRIKDVKLVPVPTY